MTCLAAVVVLTTVQGQANHAQSSERNRIRVTFLNCSGSSADLDSAKLYLLDTTNWRHVEGRAQYSVTKTRLGVEADISLSPGFYDLGIIERSCSDETLLPVLPDRNQDALLIGSRRLLLRESSAMIAGTAPFTGYTASIVYYPQDQHGSGPKTLVEDPARVQGDSYYATGVAPGTVRLRIRTADRSAWLDFKVGTIGPTNRNIIFNVSASDVKTAISAPTAMCYPRLPAKQKCYN